MPLSTWLLYVAAVLVLTVTPGPSVLMCVSTSVNQGARKGLVVALGSTTAIVGIMVLSALGLGAALAASETLFAALKWLGVAYLAYLGLSALLAPAQEIGVAGSGASQAPSQRRLWTQGFGVGASNPKALLFFGALFPQFITLDAPRLPQFLVLGATFVFFELFWLTVYTLLAARAKGWLQRPGRARLFNRSTGWVFLVAAGVLAGSKRGAG